MAVTLRDTVSVPGHPDQVFALVDDLARYPDWTDLVARARPLAPEGGRPAWEVDLQGRLGRLARSKRLRMVRTHCDAPRMVVFERREESRDHAAWRLQVEVESDADADGCEVAMTFDYSGGLWGPVIERLLRDGITRSKPRLVALADDDDGPGRSPGEGR
jgi:hypothetical protein